MTVAMPKQKEYVWLIMFVTIPYFFYVWKSPIYMMSCEHSINISSLMLYEE